VTSSPRAPPALSAPIRPPPLSMKPGDTIEVEITGIGTLRNKIIAED
jgi:2-keto-4-pentenoate hydratase/2-oxohepta-3-ene-1,7-dioic acid hydratase in catechol pathway